MQLAAAAEKQSLGVSLPFWTRSRPIHHHPMSRRLLLLLSVVASSWSYRAAVLTKAWRYDRPGEERANPNAPWGFVRCVAPHKLMARVIPYGDYIARMAEGLLAGQSRGRTCTPASYPRGARGGGPVSGARRPRAGRYRLSRPCPG